MAAASVAVESPPYSNTGVKRTTGDIRIRPHGASSVSVDWLEWTSDAVFGLEDFIPELRGAEVQDVGHGMYGYREQRMVEGVRILFGGRDDMGRHFSLTGAVLRRLISSYGVSSEDLLRRVLKVPSCRLTRLDVAVDAVNFGLDRDRLARYFEEHYLVTRLRTWREYSTRDMDGSFLPGCTFYVGQPGGQLQVRVYDKKAERVQRAEAVFTADVRDWWRFEWQMRSDKAHAFGELLAFSDWSAVLSALVGLLDFVEPSSDPNRRRWLRAPWFGSIMGMAKRGRLQVEEGDWSYERSRQDLFEVKARQFARVAIAGGMSGDELGRALFEYGVSRLTAEDWAVLEQVRGEGSGPAPARL